MSEAQIHPPSEQRLAEARRAGHVPHAPLVGLFAAWTVCSALLLGGAAALSRGFMGLARLVLNGDGHGGAPSLAAVLALLRAEVGPLLLLLSALVFAVVALAVFITQGPAFGLGSAARLRLAPLQPGRTARLLFALGLPAIVLGLAPRLLRVNADNLLILLRDAAVWTAFLLGACALVDASLARARHVRSLWLTRAQHQQELRESHGAPEIRKARQQLAREARTRVNQ